MQKLWAVFTVLSIGNTILNSSGSKLWDTFHNLNIYYANVCAIFSQQLIWHKMCNWCQMKALFSSFNMISYTFFNDLYFQKYIHRNYMASRWGWTGRNWTKPIYSDCRHCGQKFNREVFLQLKAKFWYQKQKISLTSSYSSYGNIAPNIYKGL